MRRYLLVALFIIASASVFALDGSEPMPLCRPTQTNNCKPPAL